MSVGPRLFVSSLGLRIIALALLLVTLAIPSAGQTPQQAAPQPTATPQGVSAPASQPTPPADTAKPTGAPPAQAAQTPAQTPQPTAAPAPPAPTTGTPRRGTAYSAAAVFLVVMMLLLLGLLFWLLLRWSHRLDQTSYLGSVYKESVEDFEYKRLATVPTERLNNGEYHREVQQDSVWMREHPYPTAPEGYEGYEHWGGPPGTGPGFGFPPPPGQSLPPPPPPGLGLNRQRGGDPTTGLPSSEAEAQRRAREEYETYRQARAKWDQELYAEARARYQRDLATAREQAKERTSYATDVDLSVLRGRGAEFVLEFTTVVVIIFAAVVLGVLDILGTEQIGTLLAAIAGYVLGRATTRTRGAADARVPTGPPAAATQGAPNPREGK